MCNKESEGEDWSQFFPDSLSQWSLLEVKGRGAERERSRTAVDGDIA